MSVEACLSTGHGSSRGLVPHVQNSGNCSSPDIHTHHHGAPCPIFTPGGSLATDPYLISGPGPSTVTEDEPVDEVMRPDKNDGPESHSCSYLWISRLLNKKVVDRNVIMKGLNPGVIS